MHFVFGLSATRITPLVPSQTRYFLFSLLQLIFGRYLYQRFAESTVDMVCPKSSPARSRSLTCTALA